MITETITLTTNDDGSPRPARLFGALAERAAAIQQDYLSDLFYVARYLGDPDTWGALFLGETVIFTVRHYGCATFASLADARTVVEHSPEAVAYEVSLNPRPHYGWEAVITRVI